MINKNDDAFQGLDNRIKKQIVNKSHPGIAYTVFQKGKVDRTKYFGYQDLENEISLSKQTIFRIYSLTKPIISILILKLIQEGKFDFEDKVKEFLPEFSNFKVFRGGNDPKSLEHLNRDISIQDLMTHMAGFSYGFQYDHPIDKIYFKLFRKNFGALEPTTFTKELTEIPLMHQPGANWAYGLESDILGIVAERALDMRLDKVLVSNLFTDLEMNDTNFYLKEIDHARLAKLYIQDLKKNLKEIDNYTTQRFKTPEKIRFYSGGGGLVSTMNDYQNVLSMLLHDGQFRNKQIIDSELLSMLYTNQVPTNILPLDIPWKNSIDYNGYGYGMGVRVKIHKNKYPSAIGEFGWGGFGGSFCIVDRENQAFGLVMTQFMGSHRTGVVNDFIHLMYKSLSDLE